MRLDLSEQFTNTQKPLQEKHMTQWEIIRWVKWLSPPHCKYVLLPAKPISKICTKSGTDRTVHSSTLFRWATEFLFLKKNQLFRGCFKFKQIFLKKREALKSSKNYFAMAEYVLCSWRSIQVTHRMLKQVKPHKNLVIWFNQCDKSLQLSQRQEAETIKWGGL